MGRVENTQQFRLLNRNIKTDTTVDYKNQKALNKAICLIHNPKQLFAKLKQLKPKENFRKGEKAKGCSSEKERKVNALALRAEEGRDYLR